MQICQEIADRLHWPIEIVMGYIHSITEERYRKDEIETWLQEEGYYYTDSDIEEIYEQLAAHYDNNLGIYDNIENAHTSYLDFKLNEQ